MIWGILAGLITGVASYEAVTYGEALRERREVYAQAEAYAAQAGKPLLVVGAPKFGFNHGCGDTTVDIDPTWLGWCPDGQIADIRDLPFQDKEFGSSYSSHVLEHLDTIADCRQAISELKRVADKAFIVVPKKTSLLAWLYPEHHLWVTPVPGGYIVEQR